MSTIIVVQDDGSIVLDGTLVKSATGAVTPPTPTPTPDPTQPPIPAVAPGDHLVLVGWPIAGAEQLQTRSQGMVTGATAFQITVPMNFVVRDPTKTGYISMVEVPGHLRTIRETCVSKTAFDFNRSTALMYDNSNTSPAFSFAVKDYVGNSDFRVLNGDTFYVNVRDWYKGAPSLHSPQLGDVLFNLKTPNS